MPLMTRGGAQPVKVHTQFKREPINAGLTFMVIYSCFCACFCTSTSTQRRERERERESEGETKRERKGGRRRETEGERGSAEGLRGCLDARGAARWLGPL